jgi:hypothetical protein
LLFYKDARVHCVVLKIRARTAPHNLFRRFGLVSLKFRCLLFSATDPSGPNSVLGPALPMNPYFPLHHTYV